MAIYELVEGDGGWSASSEVRIGNGLKKVYPNHDSDRTGGDVIALVKQLDSLPGFGQGQGGWSVDKPRGIPKKIWDLAEALRKPDVKVLIEKGIHQRTTRPHIRIKLSQGAASYHVELSTSPAGIGNFNWRTVGVTFITTNAHVLQTWPEQYQQNAPDRRRGSISLGTAPSFEAACGDAADWVEKTFGNG